MNVTIRKLQINKSLTAIADPPSHSKLDCSIVAFIFRLLSIKALPPKRVKLQPTALKPVVPVL